MRDDNLRWRVDDIEKFHRWSGYSAHNHFFPICGAHSHRSPWSHRARHVTPRITSRDSPIIFQTSCTVFPPKAGTPRFRAKKSHWRRRPLTLSITIHHNISSYSINSLWRLHSSRFFECTELMDISNDIRVALRTVRLHLLLKNCPQFKTYTTAITRCISCTAQWTLHDLFTKRVCIVERQLLKMGVFGENAKYYNNTIPRQDY